MKNKNLLLILSILLFSISLASCSSDDDNDDTGNNSANLYVNDRAINLIQDLNTITYNYKSGSDNIIDLDAILYADDDKVTTLSIHILNLDMNNIKVGDNLAEQKYYEVMLLQSDGTYILNDALVTNKTQYNEYKGKVIVKSFNKESKTIQLEFSEITIPLMQNMYPNFNKLVKIKGHISATMELANRN